MSEIQSYWKNPDDGKNHYSFYLKGEKKSKFLVKLFKKFVSVDSEILELGASVGRNMVYLQMADYKYISGIEINYDAVVNRITSAYIANTSIESIIKNYGTKTIDVIYTMAVLEHIPPESEWIFKEITRISRMIITIEDEKTTSWRHFPRNYKQVFETLGGKQIYKKNCFLVKGLDHKFIARVIKFK